MAMSLEQALSYPGEMLAVWNRSGLRCRLAVCSIADGKLTEMAATEMTEAGRAKWSSDLETRGVRQGATNGVCPFTWSIDGRFTVWSLTDTVVDSDDQSISMQSGDVVARADVACVISFLDPASLGHRGVKVVTHAGDELVVAEEEDPAAELDPTYGVDNVMIDAAWATFLGLDLAVWLGVPHEDELP
jgi:hypothetical protein